MKYAVRVKFFLAIVILALVVVSIVYLVDNPSLKRVPAPAKEVKTDQAEVVIDGFHFAKSSGDKENWELNAKKAEMKKDSAMAHLDDLEAVYNANNGSVLTLKADKGLFDTQSKNVKLISGGNGVVITSNSGYRMSTNSLSWNDKKKELRTDDLVKLRGKGISIEGKGMVARSDLQEVRINNGVKTVFSQSR